MHEGKIIEHIEQGKFLCTLCLQDKGTRLHLLTAANREINLAPKRAFLVSRRTIDVSRPREELLDELKRADETRDGLKAEVDVQDLWALVSEEAQQYDHEYLTELAYDGDIGDDHLSGLVRALFENSLYFKLKDGRFLPQTRERIEQTVRQLEEAARREEQLREGGAWLRNVAGGALAEPPECAAEVIALLKELALHGEDAPQFKAGKELLARAELTDIAKSRELLVRLGIWEQDENLDLIRADLREDFSARIMAETERFSTTPVPMGDRIDRRGLAVFTIDGPWTQDFDDALSFETRGDLIRVGIHIADVAAIIPPGGPLDSTAAERGASLYLPRKQIPMLPPILSQDILSLRAEQDRPALSLLADFTRDGQLKDHRFEATVVRVRRRLTYDEVNEHLDKEPALGVLYGLSRTLRERREENGALQLSVPELQIDFDAAGAPQPRLMEQDTPSRMVIAELMILYNWLVAVTCRDRGIPILYRTQAAPSERLVPEEGESYMNYVFQQRRKLNPMMVDTKPGSHSGLGHEAYTHATSPIRRYFDLVVQRQLTASLTGRPLLYDRAALEEIRMRVEPVVRGLGRIKRSRSRYWVIRYLGGQPRKPFRALVLYGMRTKYRVVLLDFLMLADLRRTEAPELQPGLEIRVEVRRADPWADDLVLGYAEGPFNNEPPNRRTEC